MGELKRTYTKKELIGYLVGMFGQNMIYNIIASGLVAYYLQSVLFIPAFAIGIIVAVARVWDAINDPMMGTIVDRTKTKWGKCRPYLIIFPAIIGLVTILCFLNGNYTTASGAGKALIVAWAAISYIAWGMCFTVCDIPLWGITSLMTEVEEDRSKILGLARVAAGVGGIGVLIVPISQGVASIFENKGFENPEKCGFIATVLVLTIISTLLFEVAGISTRERVESSEKHYTLKENFKIMWTCKPFRQILISGILRSPLQLLMLIAISFVTYYFADNDFANLFGPDGIKIGRILGVAIIAVGIFVGQFVSMIVTPSLCKKFENKSLYNFFSIAGAVPFTLLFVFFKLAGGDITPIGWVIVIGICFLLASASYGGINVLQSVMIADCVDYEEYHNGIRPDGVFFSGQSFITKLSGGIAALIQSIVYTIVGFTDAKVEATNAALKAGDSFITYNDGKYATAMFFLITIPPAIGMLLSAIPTSKYAMSDKEHKEILDELVERRAAAKNTTDEDSVNQENSADSVAETLAENAETLVDEINNL